MSASQKETSDRENVLPLKDLFHFEHFSSFYRVYVPISILIGVVCGVAMVIFQVLIDFFTFAFAGIPTFIAPLIGGGVSGLLIYLGRREIEGSGISKAIELTHEPGAFSQGTALSKVLATSISIGSGNPVGREGPAVLIGAAIGSTIGRTLGYSNPSDMRVFLMMGSAAATAGIYKAPLGGALFATEAPYRRDARLGYFVPTVIAAITSFSVYFVAMGRRPLFTFATEFTLTLGIFPLLIFFSVIAGMISIGFAMILMHIRNVFTIRFPDWMDPILGSAFACVVIFFTGLFLDPTLTVAGMGYDVINILAETQVPIMMLVALLVGKLFSSSFVVAGRVSGGVLASSLFVGAALGSIFGQVFYPDATAAFAVLGMSGVLAATTNTPVATTILMLEMSQSFDLVIPIVLVACIAYLVSGGTSLYEGQKVSRDDEGPNFFSLADSVPPPSLSMESGDENLGVVSRPSESNPDMESKELADDTID